MNIVKIASFLGMGLGFVGTIISSWSNQKAMDETVAKKVAEALANQSNQQ